MKRVKIVEFNNGGYAFIPKEREIKGHGTKIIHNVVIGTGEIVDQSDFDLDEDFYKHTGDYELKKNGKHFTIDKKKSKNVI